MTENTKVEVQVESDHPGYDKFEITTPAGSVTEYRLMMNEDNTPKHTAEEIAAMLAEHGFPAPGSHGKTVQEWAEATGRAVVPEPLVKADVPREANPN